MIFVPAHRAWSLDAWRKPGLRSETVPAWALWLLRFQIAVPYVFGGIAKLNGDWLQGEPLRAWLAARTDFPVVGPWFEVPAVAWAMVYGGLLLDLFVVLFLLVRPTRPFGYLLAVAFHLMNARLFSIGIFPWLMIAATLLFFPPDWPRRILTELRRRPDGPPVTALLAGAAIGALVGAWLPAEFEVMHVAIAALGFGVLGYDLGTLLARQGEVATAATPPGPFPLSVPASALLALWVTVQVVVPLRHYLIPGKVHWTEEGHLFSWHMKLRDKEGQATFSVFDPASGQRWIVDNDDYLSARQSQKMATRPDMLVQFARFLEEDFAARGYPDVAVNVDAVASLNGRPSQPLVDPQADLTAVPYPWFGHASWIVPLRHQLVVDGGVRPSVAEPID
jgi:hypothetical protein